MRHYLIALLLTISHGVTAQFHFSVGMNLGVSQLHHNTDFRNSKLQYDYQVTRERIWNTYHLPYTWEQYEDNNELRESFMQPRVTFSGNLRYSNWPVAMILEIGSSPSSYEKMLYSGTLALGKNFDLGYSDYYVTGYGGYTLVKDFGFGSKTLVNSIGDKTIRENMSAYFAPEKPLGSQFGNLFSIRLGFGKTFDKISAGIEAVGQLDATDDIKRTSKMSNLVLQVYGRFNL